MLELYDGLFLYHGSYCQVDTPLLEKCGNNKDFGKGFYLTSSREQAESFLNTSLIKAANNGAISQSQKCGYVSVYRVCLKESLLCHIFHDADADWLHCVTAHRKKGVFLQTKAGMSQYDVIAGKIADDQTNTVLTAYMAGVFGEIGKKETDDFCIRQLLPDRLKDQFCFKTEKALNCLQFLKGEKIWLQK